MLAPAAWAQQASGIAGVVRDSGGLPMPGVTVEAASPALIEKVRAVATDGEGRYSIVDLRPGTYTVTFMLAGFSTVKRQGVELGSGFTATVNVSMNVGALAETITVTGASPVVDTQTVRQQETLNTRELESLPSGNIGLQTLAYVTPGFAATQSDVGGTRDTWSAQGAYTFYHGKTGTRASYDGFRNQYFIGAASGVGYITDSGNIEELQLETTGMGAESGSGSTSLNAIPKSGSNTFRGGLDGFYSNAKMQSSNIDDGFRSFGINSSAQVQRIFRAGAQLGGPIKQDKLWFFAAIARWGSRVNQPGAYYNALQGKSGNPVTATLFYAPDLSRPAVGPQNFDEYCITAPKDPRLPGGGGNQLCGFYDIQPQFFGLGTLRVTNASEFGKQQRYWDGLTFAVNGRLPRGVRLGGGLDVGRQVDDHCYTVDVPNQPSDIANVPLPGGPFCRVVTSWGDLLDFRFRGSIPLKGGVDASFIYRNTPGAEESALLTVTSADVTFKSAARTTLTSPKIVNLYAPNSVFSDRFKQLDVAVNKSFNVGWGRVRTALDVYNVLNGNSVQNVVTAYSVRWLRPTGFLDPRLARVTASLQF